jgi:hypothetical protein
LGGKLFASIAEADNRGGGDDGHSHDVLEREPIGFTGTSRTLGSEVSLATVAPHGIQWTFSGAVIQRPESGDLMMDMREAGLRADLLAARLMTTVQRGDGGVVARHEWRSLDNHLSGPGGEPLAMDSGLAEARNQPSRTVLGGWWQSLPTVQLRLAMQLDDDGQQRRHSDLLGLVWSQRKSWL